MGQGRGRLACLEEGTGDQRASPLSKVRAPQACESRTAPPGPGCLGEALLKETVTTETLTGPETGGEGACGENRAEHRLSQRRAVRRWRVRAWPGVQKPLGSHPEPWWGAESADP